MCTLERDLDEPWYKIDKIEFFQKYSSQEIDSIIMNFDFLHNESWNHVSINKIDFVLDSLNFLEHDISQLSMILNYSNFEKLVKRILAFNEFNVINNFRFSDKSNYKKQTDQHRYEIDVIGLNRKILILIDAKQWNRRDSFSAINKAANLQLQRARALKNNPLILGDLITTLIGKVNDIKNQLPLTFIPIMVTLEESNIKLNHNKVPLVSIYKLNSFLQELNENLYYFNTIIIDKLSIQETIL
ncbi:MAG: hypothetical protein ACQERB_03150 [Promethearchaeati archaeon]